MKEPQKKSSEAPATPGNTKKKPASEQAVVENRPIDSGKAATPAAADPKPMIESSLVGSGSNAKPAEKRASSPDTTAKPATATAATSVPPVSQDPAATKSPIPAATRTEAAPEAKPAANKPEPKVVVRKVGFFPTFLGGVVAAGLGAAATYWAIPQLPEAWRPGAVETVSPEAQLDAARSAGTEAARAELATQSEALSARATEAGTEAARQALADVKPAEPAEPAAPVIPAELTERIATLEATLTALATRPAGATGEAAAPVVLPAPGVSPEALAQLAARVDAQQTRIDDLAARPQVDPATAGQVQSLVKQAEEMKQSTEDANRRAQGAAAVTALRSAIEDGAPRDQALAALAAAGISVPAALSGDVARLDQLRTDFVPAAREGLRASLDAVADNQGAMGKVANFLRVQTGARSVEPREGDDPDAVLSRANAAVGSGDIPAALALIAALPEAGQKAMSDWSARAQAWVDANTALAALAAGAN